MLTSHALTPQNIIKSFKSGAASFIPKDRIADIPAMLADVLQAKEKGEHYWSRWTARLGRLTGKRNSVRDGKRTTISFWKEFGKPLAEEGDRRHEKGRGHQGR